MQGNSNLHKIPLVDKAEMHSLAGTGEIKNSFDSGKSESTMKVDGKIEKMNEENSQVENKKLFKFVCDGCGKKFCFGSNYIKHRNRYPQKHSYYKCCNKVEDFENFHKCSRLPLKAKTVKKNQDNSQKCAADNKNQNNFICSGDVGDIGGKGDDEEEDNDTDDKDNNDDDGDDDDDDDDDNTSDTCNEDDLVYQNNKTKKSNKKKIAQQDSSKFKIYKCQECLQLFKRYINLCQHSKLVHKKQGKFKCQICDEDFNTDEDLRSHAAMHGPEDQVICKGCKKRFTTLKLYYIHAKQNPGLHCFICKLCLREFPTELMLDQHVCICQNGKPLHCACGREFTRYKDVIDHSKGTKPFSCCSCPHLANSLTAYIRHLRKHSKQKPFQCTKCDMKFAVIDFLNIHNKKFHSESENKLLNDQNSEPNQVDFHVCSFCDVKFKTIEELKEHNERIHEQKSGSEDERVQCPDCGKLLKKNRLENHRNTHKTSASLCPECGKLFDTRFKLTQHIITAHNNEPVKCEVCMKVLKTKKILNEHMKTHLKSELGGRIPQAICPMCGLGLAQKGSLARHILLTHEKHKIIPCNKTYTCQECSAVLPNRAKYYSHRRMHRAMVDRFPCEVCGREFNKKQNLKRHMYLLHDETRVLADPIFKCQFCTRCFREKKNLKRHYKMVHKVEDIL